MSDGDLSVFFDSKAGCRDEWIGRNRYYNKLVVDFYRFHTREGASILEIGCGTGFLLDALKPSRGVGVDFSGEMIRIASSKYPHLSFVKADAEDYVLDEKFDYIIISDTVGLFGDVQEVLRNIKQNCTSRTRVMITTHNFLWEPVLKAGEAVGLKMWEPVKNWLSADDIMNLLYLEGYETIRGGGEILAPKRIPIVSGFVNRFVARLPVVGGLCLMQYVIARPLGVEPVSDMSVSVVVPARNERGNISRIVESVPDMGLWTELIFVEGGSSDGTWEEIERVAGENESRRISCMRQDGEGKADAVRKGFEAASGDVLMIYDADMTVPACDLPKFYEAMASNRGEFINGSRLVYPQEKQAMRLLNLLGNKVFSMLFSYILGQTVKDTLCGTKVISRRDYGLLAECRHYLGDFDPFGDFDLLFGSWKMGLRIIEVPIRYRERSYGNTNIRRFSHGLILLKMCLYAAFKLKFR
ncbi:MAG: glycosyltransferase [Candidatus Altiarchaeota archaeon]